MKKAIGKIACAVLSLSLLVMAASTREVPTSTENASATELEEALLLVKSLVDIPSSFSEFDYYYYALGETIGVWDFYWRNEEDAYINVQIDSLGNLNSYYDSSRRSDSGFIKCSINEGKIKADAFLKKALPAIAGDLRVYDSDGSTYYSQYI